MQRFATSLTGLILLAVLAATAQAETIIETVPVGNAGNADDTTGYGGVDYNYNIGKYEVTAGQYTEFLNAVAASDPYDLYNLDMDIITSGCQIERHGTSGNYTYSPDRSSHPVNYVSWADAARFANWLHNGQPTGTLTGNPALDTGLTEDGAYYINGAMSYDPLMAVNREADWKWAITSEDEWYKAAYHKGGSANAGYWEYPTQSDTPPFPEPPPGGDNSANYYWVTLHPYATYVGAYENSEGSYGTFDQGGNVWEVNESINADGTYRGRRGGYWGSNALDLNVSERSFTPPSAESKISGFRVVQVPEPTTITLLLCGLVAGLIWRRRYR